MSDERQEHERQEHERQDSTPEPEQLRLTGEDLRVLASVIANHSFTGGEWVQVMHPLLNKLNAMWRMEQGK